VGVVTTEEIVIEATGVTEVAMITEAAVDTEVEAAGTPGTAVDMEEVVVVGVMAIEITVPVGLVMTGEKKDRALANVSLLIVWRYSSK